MLKYALNKRLLAIVLLAGFFITRPVFASSQDLFNQPFLNQIQISRATGDNADVIIAIIDEGVDFSHPDLNSSYIYEKSFLNNRDGDFLLGSHGTQIAGAIKAVIGKGQNIKFISLTACGRQEGCNLDAIIKSIYYAADHGASVINLSFEVTGNKSYLEELDGAITYAYQKNIVIVAAAGNGDSNHSGIDLSASPISPVCNDNGQNMILGVSAVDEFGNKASWSNFGYCADVSAPGANIYTTLAQSFNQGQIYGYKSGTSYSSAIVSAEAALLKLKNPGLTAREIMDLIIHSRSQTGSVSIASALNSTPSPVASPIILTSPIQQHQTAVIKSRKKFPKKPIISPASITRIKPRG